MRELKNIRQTAKTPTSADEQIAYATLEVVTSIMELGGSRLARLGPEVLDYLSNLVAEAEAAISRRTGK